jgi:hypothetical protein
MRAAGFSFIRKFVRDSPARRRAERTDARDCLCLSPAKSRQLPLLGEDAARLERPRRVNRRVALFDVADDAVLVEHERGARAEAAVFVEDAVVADCRAFEIAEQRERDLDVFGEARVGGRTVNADP